jgi:hypothetical protein
MRFWSISRKWIVHKYLFTREVASGQVMVPQCTPQEVLARLVMIAAPPKNGKGLINKHPLAVTGHSKSPKVFPIVALGKSFFSKRAEAMHLHPVPQLPVPGHPPDIREIQA